MLARNFYKSPLDRFMKNLPSNIEGLLHQYEPRMTGHNQLALQAIRHSLDRLNKQRREDINLRNIEIAAYQGPKGVTNELFYLIRIKGRKNSYYHNRVVKLFMFVFDSYPKEPPEIAAGNLYDAEAQVQKRFLHLNVSERGHFCMKTNQSNQEYYEYTTLRDILVELEDTLYSPNVTSSYNNQLYTAYQSAGNNQQYLQLLNAQARLMEPSQSDSDSDSDEELP